MQNIAVYAGTFDPISFGHIDLISRATQLFESVIIAIASNPAKNPLFSLEERVSLAKECLQSYPNVTVEGFDGLLLDFAHKRGANILLRGLRTVSDFDYEFQLACMNRTMNNKIETLFLMPDEKYMAISSTLIREIATLKGEVKAFVPKLVVDALKIKLGSADGTKNY